MWRYGSFHRDQLPHQLIVDVETSAGVQYDKIVSLVSSPIHASLADAHDIGLGSVRLIGAIHIDGKIAP